jgi:hypothetical protein
MRTHHDRFALRAAEKHQALVEDVTCFDVRRNENVRAAGYRVGNAFVLRGLYRYGVVEREAALQLVVVVEVVHVRCVGRRFHIYPFLNRAERMGVQGGYLRDMLFISVTHKLEPASIK